MNSVASNTLASKAGWKGEITIDAHWPGDVHICEGGVSNERSMSGVATDCRISIIQYVHQRNQRSAVCPAVKLKRGWPVKSALAFICINLASVVSSADSGVKISLTGTIVSDSVSHSNPKALPGAIVEYQVQVMNSNLVPLISDSLNVTNAVPASLSLVVGDWGTGTGAPFVFVEGAQPSNLNCPFQALANIGDCIDFSADGGASFDYQPAPNEEGVDPAVTHLRFRLRGIMAPASPAPTYFSIRYRMKVD